MRNHVLKLIIACSLIITAGNVLSADESIKATASSEQQLAEYAVDGNHNSQWQSGPEAKAWLSFDFGDERKLRNISIQWGNASAKKYTIEVQPKGGGWEEIGGVNGGKKGEYKYFDFGTEMTVCKLRINCIERATEFDYAICEVNFSPEMVDGIKAGVMNTKVKCKADPSQTYAIYIPNAYIKSRKKFPVVYGFSPDAWGADPVKLLQDAAEKHGFIVIGSNNARNGEWEPIRAAIKAVVKDSSSRFRIDAEKCYACGFSGGARMSFYMARMYPSMIAGVIPCCAGFPDDSYSPPPNLKVYGLSGTSDFNNKEVKSILRSMGWPNNENTQFNEFNGGHGWPPKENLETAMDWLFGE